jgi:ribosome-binding factor A
VFYDSLAGPDGDGDILAALGEHRVRLQSSIARQIRAKKTPILIFRPDDVIRAAERIEELLRRTREAEDAPDLAPGAGPDTVSDGGSG